MARPHQSVLCETSSYAFYQIYFIFLMYVCVSYVCECPQKSGEGVGSHGTEVSGVCEPPDMGAGYWGSCTGAKCSHFYHLSSLIVKPVLTT